VITDYSYGGRTAGRAGPSSPLAECPVSWFTGTGSEGVAVVVHESRSGRLCAQGRRSLLALAPARSARRPEKNAVAGVKEAENRYQTLFNTCPSASVKPRLPGKFSTPTPRRSNAGYPDRTSLLNVNAGDLFADTSDSALNS